MGADLSVFGRQVFGNADGEIALRQRRHAFAHQGDRLVALGGLGLLAGARLGFRLQAGRFRGFEIDRDGIVHVEQAGLDDRADLGCPLIRPRQSGAEAALRPACLQDLADQLREQQGIAADIPARFEPDPGVDLADARDGRDIILVELSLGDPSPV